MMLILSTLFAFYPFLLNFLHAVMWDTHIQNKSLSVFLSPQCHESNHTNGLFPLHNLTVPKCTLVQG